MVMFQTTKLGKEMNMVMSQATQSQMRQIIEYGNVSR